MLPMQVGEKKTFQNSPNFIGQICITTPETDQRREAFSSRVLYAPGSAGEKELPQAIQAKERETWFEEENSQETNGCAMVGSRK